MVELYEKPKVLYLCDGQVEGCRKTNCYMHGVFAGPCYLTSDIRHAANFERRSGVYREKTLMDRVAEAYMQDVGRIEDLP